MEKHLRAKLQDGKFNNVSPIRSRAMSAVKSSGNKTTEAKFCTALLEAGLSGWETHPKIIGNPDIYFFAYKAVIFLDGCFWHGCPNCGHIPKTNSNYWKAKIERNIQRDTYYTQELTERGYLVLRFWEHELLNNIDECISTLQNALEDNLYKLSSTID